jgi:hypothetical protein
LGLHLSRTSTVSDNYVLNSDITDLQVNVYVGAGGIGGGGTN